MSRKNNVLRSMVVLLVFIFALQLINIMDVKAAYKTVDLVYVDTFPAKIEYDTFDEIDATGGLIGILYKDGSIDKISMKPEMLSGYDMSVVGEQRVVITYNKKEVSSYMITVREVLPQYVTLNEYELNLVAGKSANLYAVVSPSNTTDKTVTYKSEDEKIARVSTDGIVYAVGEGTVNIIAEAKNGKKAVCKVNVRVEANNIYYPYGNYDYVTMQIYQVKDNQLIVIPSEAAKTVSYSSNNVLVATVDKYGKVTAVGPGKAEITARTSNGLFAKFAVKVENPIEKVDTPKEKSIVIGTSIVISDWDIKIKGKFSGFAPTEELDFSVENPEIASIVGKNTLITHKRGTTYIYYSLNGVRIAKTKLNVIDIEAEKIELSETEKLLYETESFKLSATVLPDKSTEEVFWKSSKESVAYVDNNGNVTALKAGKAKITAYTKSGIKSSCTITVEKVPEPVKKTEKIESKTEIQLSADLPAGGEWIVKDPDNILEVEEAGSKMTVTGKRGGKAKITYKNGARSAIYTINVLPTNKTAKKTIKGAGSVDLKPGFGEGKWTILSGLDCVRLTKNNNGKTATVTSRKVGEAVIEYTNGVDTVTYTIAVNPKVKTIYKNIDSCDFYMLWATGSSEAGKVEIANKSIIKRDTVDFDGILQYDVLRALNAGKTTVKVTKGLEQTKYIFTVKSTNILKSVSFRVISGGYAEPKFEIANPSNKRIKYVYITVSYLNAVDDVIGNYDSNYGVKEKTYTLIGPVESYDIEIWDCKGEYNFQSDVIKYMKVKTMKIEYFDGTTKTYNINKKYSKSY